MQPLVPESIETPRLILRQFRDSDWSGLLDYLSDPVAVRFTFVEPLAEEGAKAVIESIADHWQRLGYGPYAVEVKATGQCIGTVGFFYPSHWPEPEIKWALARKFWGQGYAKEAAQAVKVTGAACLPNLKLISFIHGENKASISLAKAMGATFERTMPFRGGQEWHIYRHDYDE